MIPSGETEFGMDRQMKLVQSAWQSIRSQVESVRVRVQEEITQYPPPIPACDAHFNHLLEERARIIDELGRIDAAAKANAAPADGLDLIDKFLASSSYLDEKAKQKIRFCLTVRPDV